MTWFAFQGSGSVYNLNGLAEKELVSTGAHGYATEAEAQAHPNGPENPEQSILLAEAEAIAASPVGGGTAGVQAGTTPAASLSGINAIGQFFNNLGNSNTWIRVVKVVIGGMLVIVGLAHITGAGNAIASTARKVPAPI